MGRVLVGTSGWAYPSWKPKFYPKEVSAKKFLQFYASRLNSVEVNYTFRTFLPDKTAENWLATTPADFLFTFKMHQSITHFRRLKDVDALVAKFFQALQPFDRAKKIGAILIQLPHNLKVDAGLLTQFLDGLPRAARYAIEFRHESWLNEVVYDQLRQRNIALCVTEGTKELSTPDLPLAGFGYYRLRHEQYGPRRILAFADKLANAEMDPTFVYFKHEENPQGALNAVRLSEVVRGGQAKPSMHTS